MKTLLPLLIALISLSSVAVQAEPREYFAIHVVDDSTGRGVPLVQLETTDRTKFFTDSNGYVAFQEPGLMGERVWLGVESLGYDYAHESFGSKGIALDVAAGGTAEIKIRRLNIAERLYRLTGRGIYRDSILLGKKPPIAEGALCGKVIGQDSALATAYRGRMFWVWGDTNRPGHPLGNFYTTCANSELPRHGGLDPTIGVDFHYFTDPKSGFAREMAPIKPGPVWLDGLFTAHDDKGEERLLARFSRVSGLKPVEQGIVVFNDKTGVFDALKRIPLATPLAPSGHSFRTKDAGQSYVYFTAPYPMVRVKDEWQSIIDPSAYEAYTCLKDGETFSRKRPALDRDAGGKLVWRWRKNTPPLTPGQIDDLVKDGAARREECPLRLFNVDDGRPIRLHGASVAWNDYRRAWVMIGLQFQGDSLLGEVWFAEAPQPEGPWAAAKKIATHARKGDAYDFYNPVQHPEFSQKGGRFVYFEGTYTTTFSGNPRPTPCYDYNQLMYRVDLGDRRLTKEAMQRGSGR